MQEAAMVLHFLVIPGSMQVRYCTKLVSLVSCHRESERQKLNTMSQV